MWRTVITWYPNFFFFFFFFLTIQANLFRESLQCGEQSSHGFPFFFFFFFIYLFREYLQCGEHDLVFPIPAWQTVPGHTQNINCYLYDSPVQPASRSHLRGKKKNCLLKAGDPLIQIHTHVVFSF